MNTINNSQGSQNSYFDNLKNYGVSIAKGLTLILVGVIARDFFSSSSSPLQPKTDIKEKKIGISPSTTPVKQENKVEEKNVQLINKNIELDGLNKQLVEQNELFSNQNIQLVKENEILEKKSLKLKEENSELEHVLEELDEKYNTSKLKFTELFKISNEIKVTNEVLQQENTEMKQWIDNPKVSELIENIKKERSNRVKSDEVGVDDSFSGN